MGNQLALVFCGTPFHNTTHPDYSWTSTASSFWIFRQGQDATVGRNPVDWRSHLQQQSQVSFGFQPRILNMVEEKAAGQGFLQEHQLQLYLFFFFLLSPSLLSTRAKYHCIPLSTVIGNQCTEIAISDSHIIIHTVCWALSLFFTWTRHWTSSSVISLH